MYILDDDWSDQYLDYHCGIGQTRIGVLRWHVLGSVDNLYIVRSTDLWMLYNYLREIGPVEVLRKIVSRTKERLRNRKFVSAGVGIVLETKGNRFAAGERVVFLAPSHPRCVDRIVLDDDLIASARTGVTCPETDEAVHYRDQPLACDAGWTKFAGWSPFSGIRLDRAKVEACLRDLDLAMDQSARLPARVLPVMQRSTTERAGTSPRMHQGFLTAALFGLGNYAKTIILPNLDRRIVIQSVHEIDPTQIGRYQSLSYVVDTFPLLRDDERPDVVFIAGFHHTHADLAIQAIERGAVAVIEKPLVTRADQFDRLCRAVEETSGRIYAGFHKRYSPFNRYIVQDLSLEPTDPVSCHCIVYEIPLPHRHWYEWPNSGTRIVSNGCHWIDHFLFLNSFSPVTRRLVVRTGSGDLTVVLELENGASFSMTLTDAGSSRIGVQEHVEFRANGRTAHIVNATRYEAESSSRILRRKKAHKYESFRNMYKTITSNIIAGKEGDSLKSIMVSTQAMLELENELRPDCGSVSRC